MWRELRNIHWQNWGSSGDSDARHSRQYDGIHHVLRMLNLGVLGSSGQSADDSLATIGALSVGLSFRCAIVRNRLLGAETAVRKMAFDHEARAPEAEFSTSLLGL